MTGCSDYTTHLSLCQVFGITRYRSDNYVCSSCTHSGTHCLNCDLWDSRIAMIFRSHCPDRDSTPCLNLEQASMSKSQHGLVGAELNARARGTVPEYGSAFAGETMVVLSESGFTGWEDFQDGVGGQPSFDRLPPQQICYRTNGCGRDARAPRMAPTILGQVHSDRTALHRNDRLVRFGEI